ncbi:MAG TPA: hypothetical protein PLD20_14455 [Blastocatellia bacterium]|nr:hypothetical protein [Blastocatellia bacterium]HMZ19133.1 hypothetical protein [Blastocatellia bacterium]HNG28442.1 hypothetical protein [Blastocatellia bacterium]
MTIELKPETATALHNEAAKFGLATSDFVQSALEERLKQTTNKNPAIAPLSAKEGILLRQVNEWLPSETWQEYQELREKFRAETLTEAEHQRLIEIYRRIEVVNAQRIRFIAELARLRQVSLEEMMDQLGINPPSYE